MSYYLVILKSKNLVAHLNEEQLKTLRHGLQKLQTKGTVKAAYSKVGGGMVFIVESPSNAQLTVELRRHFITDAEVIPLVPLDALVEAHVENRETGKVGV